jgi:hypothetical protein
LTTRNKVGSERYREGFDGDLWHGEPPFSKCTCDVLVIRIVGRSEYPPLGLKFSKIDLSAASPLRTRSSYDDEMVVEQVFNVHIICSVIASEWRHTPFQVEVMCTLAQHGIDGRRGNFADTQDHVWIGLRKFLNQVRQERGHSGRRKADPYLPERWVIQKFDVFDALPQFITGMGAPAGTQVDIINKLNREINAAISDPRMRARIAELGASPQWA